jgi:hypothetical protein
LRGGGDLLGGTGNDRLRGSVNTFDRFHGGPGRDHMRAPARKSTQPRDVFFDDETDAQAARDTILAGKNARARIDYSRRKRRLEIDLRRDRIGPEGDHVQGIREVAAGSGDDVLRGTGGTNSLDGGPGDDLLLGAGSSDGLSGGAGDDRVRGGAGFDFIDGAGGSDRISGGPDGDFVDTNEDAAGARPSADVVRCDDADAAVASDPLDRLHGCALVSGWAGAFSFVELRVEPQVTDNSAVFTLRCGPTDSEVDPDDGTVSSRCRGELVVRAPAGQEFGRSAFEFDVPFSSSQPPRTVEVPLTAAGREAIRAGTVVQVEAEAISDDADFSVAGYRAFIQG